MRRLSLCLAAAIAALVFVPPAVADGPVFVTQGGSGVASHDGAFHYVAVPYGTLGTVLEKIHSADKAVWWWMPLRGSWGTAAIGNGTVAGQGLSRDGRTLVLEDTSGPFSPPSRFLVVDTKRMKVVRRITLPGSFSFDALSPDASKMFLIQFTQAGIYDPSHYIVREYDLRTNRLLPGKIADRTDPEKTMAGYAQVRTTSANGRWVYTLYQKPSGMPFVHALDTVAGVAHCIDLPWSQTNSGVYNLVLSLRDHDRTLAVDYRSGRPVLSVAVGSWQISPARSGGAFPWAWVGAGIGAGLALLAAGAVLLLRRRRGEEVEERARHELGLA